MRLSGLDGLDGFRLYSSGVLHMNIFMKLGNKLFPETSLMVVIPFTELVFCLSIKKLLVSINPSFIWPPNQLVFQKTHTYTHNINQWKETYFPEKYKIYINIYLLLTLPRKIVVLCHVRCVENGFGISRLNENSREANIFRVFAIYLFIKKKRSARDFHFIT